MPTPNMGLDIPVPGVTAGPAWANKLDSSLNAIDSHDHSSGKGPPIAIGNITGAGTMAQQNAASVAINGGTITGIVNLATTVANVAGLRAIAGAPAVNGIVYGTRGYFADGDGGGAFYRWVASNTDADDGILTVKITSVATGRLKLIHSGSVNALQIGFDATGATAIAHLLFNATSVLRANGVHELFFPPGNYTCTGAEQIAPSASPLLGFAVRGLPGARLVGPTPGPTVAPVGIGIYARGVGDVGEAATIISADVTGTVSLASHTFVGGETVLPAVANITGLSVGNHIMCYIGAETTDAGGWCNSWVIAEIAAITPGSGTTGDVTIKQPLPSPTPATAGINVPPRNVQTHHTIRKMIGFQDNVSVVGFKVNNVFFATQACRNLTIDCTWEYCTFAINAFACTALKIPTFFADIATGYNAGGGGAFAHYGGAIFLQSCYGTKIGLYKCENQDGVACIVQELSSAGTRIETLDVSWNATLSPTGSLGLIQSVTPVDVGCIISRGGYGGGTISDNVRVGMFEDRASNTYQTLAMRADCTDRLVWRGQPYTGKRNIELILPLPTGAGTATLLVPFHGLVRRWRLRATTLTGVTHIYVDGTNTGTSYEISTGWVVAANKWYDIGVGSMLSVGSPNMAGYCQPKLLVTVDGTTPAGNAFFCEIEMFVPDTEIDAQITKDGDTTVPLTVVSNGAPTANASFLGQRCFDTAGKHWYTAKDIGTGATDWQS
jgi:hypothetical protein